MTIHQNEIKMCMDKSVTINDNLQSTTAQPLNEPEQEPTS